MKKNLKRNIQQIFRVDETELALIREKMETANIRNKEAYFRRMVLDGYVLRLDFSDVREMTRLLSNATNNLNQIARRTNSDGSLFAPDIQKIQADYDLLWGQVKLILQKLAKI
ncbi:MAG: plasmid mobilization relaxosome protein MobC [Oscillospiraceae bacterium]|nr:plasmid mobilization relaxosome protein MobC [Oscillospiraceae bacterium]